MADSNTDHTKPVHVVGPYAVYGRLAAGGMATVHLGRVIEPGAVGKTVAIKRLHPQFSKDPEFVAMFIDEAKLAERIKHPNVVDTINTLTMGQELLLVMEYISGECFSKLLRAARRKNLHPSVPVVGAIIDGMLRGLHAAHEVRDDEGNLLNVVHRDVSPQNVMIGHDGVAKVLDFGVAKASARIQITRDGQMKGKLSYMSPEQLQGHPVDRRADVFACGVVLWEALTRKRLFVADEAGEVMAKILRGDVPAPSTYAPELSVELDAVVLRALHQDNAQRYQTAEQLADDLRRVIQVAPANQVVEWMDSVAGEILGKRARLLADIESAPIDQAVVQASQASFADSIDFDQLHSWAEREAARVIANQQESQDKEDSTASGAHSQHPANAELRAPASVGPGRAAVDESPEISEQSASPRQPPTGQRSDDPARRGDSEPPTTVSVPVAALKELVDSSREANDEEQTAVTLTVAPQVVAPVPAERETIAPARSGPPPLPAHLRGPVSATAAPARNRWTTLLSLAATVLALSAAVFFQLQDPTSWLSSALGRSPAQRVRALRPIQIRLPTVAERRTDPERVAGQDKPLPAGRGEGQVDNSGDSSEGAQAALTVRDLEKVERATKAMDKRPARVVPRATRPVPVVRRATTRARAKTAPSGGVSASAATDCSVPYWLDARGIRRLKVACL